MRRIITLVVAALAMAGCSLPTAPPAPSDDAALEAARSLLKGASKMPAKASTRLASN